MKKRVDWLVSQLKTVGGAETFLRAMAPRLQQAGWDLHVVSLVSGGLLVGELRQAGVPVVELGVRNKADLGVFFRLVRLWRQDPPDLIHTHLYHAGLLGRSAARLLGLGPVIVHQQGPELSRSRLRSWLDRRTSGMVHLYIASCQAVAGVLQQREAIPTEKIRVIFAGIDLERSTHASLPVGWPVPDGVPSLVCVGRLSAEKGQANLLVSLGLLKEEGLGFHAVMMGDGPQRASLEAQCASLGLQGCVTFTGLRRDIQDWLSHFDLFVLPSDWEGISLALLEAMAACLPVVATRAGGTPEVVVDGKTGLLVPPHDPATLCDAIARLLQDKARRKEMGRAGRQRVEQAFSLPEVVRQIDSLYRELLKLDLP